MKDIRLRLTARQHGKLRDHLFSEDGKEAVAVALCGRAASLDSEILLVHKIELVPHVACKRSRDRVDWPPTLVEHLLGEAAENGMAIVKVHSHPDGCDDFSDTDDQSDRKLFESVYGWVDGDRPHASAIMLPDGRMRARGVLVGGKFTPVRHVQVVGDEVLFWLDRPEQAVPMFAERHTQLFGSGTTALLGRLRIAVVGCSGTGSPVIEQLVRLGVGEIVLVDPDHVEERNLNRILGATVEDADRGRLKVDVIERNINGTGLGTHVHKFAATLQNREAMRAVAASDFVMGCMDSLSGRHVLARLARYYLLPYVDVGVKLEALENGIINQVAGSVHYLQPTGLDFVDRGVFSLEALESEDLLRASPGEYRDRLARGYVRGVQVDRPAVVSVNMCFASLAVNELLARLHSFRMDGNEKFGTTQISLSHAQFEHEQDSLASSRVLASVGRGDIDPPLDMPSLASHSCG